MRQRPILPVSVAGLVMAVLAAHLLVPGQASGLAPSCGGQINAAPPGDLLMNGAMNCTWTIVAESGHRVLLYLNNSTLDCWYYGGAWVYDGDSEDDNLIYNYCTYYEPDTIISSSNTLYVEVVDEVLEGLWFASYTQVDEQTLGCDRVLNGSAGQFHSPDADGDGHFESNANCSWIIKLEDKRRIKLSIDSIDLYILPWDIYCRDYLMVYDGESEAAPLIGQYCGTVPPALIISTSNALFLRFVSDHGVSYTGFTASYTEIVDGCWNTWSPWSTCDQTCEGTQSRERNCSSPPPGPDGRDCIGQNSEQQDCNAVPCPVNGEWGIWGPWQDCSKTCGQGTGMRTRECDSPAPAYGGANCTGNFEEMGACYYQECPVNGGWGPWSEWGNCSQTCGQGTRMRTRDCDSPSPAYGGANCTGNSGDTEGCFIQECPVNGGLGPWNQWGECSQTCGQGTRMRNRNCDSPVPAYGGANCTENFEESEGCFKQECPVNGGLGPWSQWGACSQTCGQGTRMRTRDCDSPAPAYGGANCTGNSEESEGCFQEDCPVNGGLGPWSEWGVCSQTCSPGTRMRTRDCDSPVPAYGGANCTGNSGDTEGCFIQECPVNGGLGPWNQWGECSQTCGQGTRMRNRNCDSPVPAYGGANCTENFEESDGCFKRECPANGGLGPWSQWGACSQTCGPGTRIRARDCDSPAPAYGGANCTGNSEESEGCFQEDCPVNGGLGPWSEWGVCSQTCGPGTRMRTRDCDSPVPAYGGANCTGNSGDTEGCLIQECPVNGGLGPWNQWGECSQTCGQGTRMRNRNCDSPVPAYGGANCTENFEESEGCFKQECPVNGGLGPWSQWGDCSQTCGQGTRMRTRDCDSPAPAYGGANCTGNSEESEGCFQQDCPVNGGLGPWSEWGVCSLTCGQGTRMRTRDCDSPVPAYGGANCTENSGDTEGCFIQECPVNGGLGPWNQWGECSQTCGQGTRMRNRNCDSPVPAYGGANCTGNFEESEGCFKQECPVNGGLGPWSQWGGCSQTCGQGTRMRSRDCDSPPPAYGGANCTGNSEESEGCFQQDCPVNGGLGPWSEWGVCSLTCGQGTRMRTRDCDSPAPAYGGANCTGNSEDTEGCLIQECPVNGGFGPWHQWGECSQTCGQGTRMRTRDCDSPVPAYGGANCTGNSEESEGCFIQECQVNGGWGLWNQWGECSQTCGQGTRMRNRNCDSPVPAYGGANCTGNSEGYEGCFCEGCQEENGPFNECVEAFNQGADLCGDNSRCLNTKNGYKCKCCRGYKRNKKTGRCEAKPGASHRFPCCGDCQHVECSVTGKVCAKDGIEYDSVEEMVLDRCQKGYRPKKELAVKNYGVCEGPVTHWSEWGGCSVTCGKGLKMKTRTPTRPLKKKEQKKIPLTMQACCYNPPCPGCPSCSEACQMAQVCEVFNGTAVCRCPGCSNDESDKVCGSLAGGSNETFKSACVLQRTACKMGVGFELISLEPCPDVGGFGPWGDWGMCSVTCGGGTQRRTRQCDSPAPAYGGDDCDGQTEQTQECNTQPCPTECSLVSRNGYYTIVLNGITFTTTEAVDFTTCEGDCENGNECSESGTEERDLLFSCASGSTITKSVSFPTSCCCS